MVRIRNWRKNTLQRWMSNLLVVASDTFENRTVYTYKKYLEKTQWLCHEELQKLRLKNFKALMMYAYENVPFYHQTFRKAGFRPSEFKSFKDITKIPVLSRLSVRSELNRMVPVGLRLKAVSCWTTSGTTAAPVKLYRGKNDLSWAVAAELRGYGWAGYKTGDKMGLVWQYDAERMRNFVFRLEKLLARTRFLNVYTMTESSMGRFARNLHRFRPSFVRGYSGSLNILATYLLHNPEYQISPQAVFTSASTLLPNYRRTIEKAFSSKVYDYYGCNEVSHIAAQCGRHEGLHVSEENIFLEILDDDDETTGDCEEGRILVTNLHGYDMPFIRYDLGDLGKLFDESCTCGRKLSLLKPTGRIYEHFLNSDGSFTCLKDFQTVFEGIPVSDFQVIQESLDEITIKIVPNQGFMREHLEFLKKHIKTRGIAEIRIELVNSIPVEGSGKIRHIVSKLPTRYS